MNSKISEPLPSWIDEELASLDLTDERLNHRARRMLSDQYSNPHQTIYGSASDEAAAKGAWRFQKNKKVQQQAIFESHYQSTLSRIKGHSVVLGVADTSELPFSTQTEKEENGPLHSKKNVGFLVHPTVIFTPEKLALGTIDFNLWSRDEAEYGKSKDRKNRPLEEKESFRWILSFQQLVRLQQELPQTEVVSVSDAESDIYELFLEAQNHPQGPSVLVRAAYNRSLEGQLEKLWPYLENHPNHFEIGLEIPRKGKRAARQAQATVSYAPVELKTPHGKQGPSIALYAVYVREIDPPQGVEALSWMLLSTRKVSKAKQAMTLIRWYSVRWQIEVFFKVLKTSCRILADQSHKAGHLQINLAFKFIVAWRILYTTMLCRETPDISCEVAFEESEWKALWCHQHKTHQLPESPPTLREVTIMLARLGGYKQWKKDMLPGPQNLAKGFSILSSLSSLWSIMNAKEQTESFFV